MASLEDFLQLAKLGHGGFGEVFLVEKKTGADKGQKYALKLQEKSKFKSHPNVLQWAKDERKVFARNASTRFATYNNQIHFILGVDYGFWKQILHAAFLRLSNPRSHSISDII